jgi:hypothetical protein
MNKIIILPFVLSLSAMLLSSCEKKEHLHEHHTSPSTLVNKVNSEPTVDKKDFSGVGPSFNCLSSQSQCIFNTEYGELSFSFSGIAQEGRMVSEEAFMIMASFRPSVNGLSLDSSNISIAKLTGYLAGKDMFMGKIPVSFKQSASNKSEFLGTTLTSRCADDFMVWTLNVQVEWTGELTNGSTKNYSLDFESVSL